MDEQLVTIVGGGPAGLAAAIQLQRYGIPAALLEREEIGGLLRNANLVENYPGFPGGIPGPQLARLFAEQARQHEVRICREEVLELRRAGEWFEVRTDRRTFRSRRMIVASGTKARRLTDLEVPASLQASIFYEVCPLQDLEGKRIAIVGAGDAAFDYALNLGRRNRVAILNRGSRVSCLPLLQERARAVPRITYHEQIRLLALQPGEGGALRLECQAPAGRTWLLADYLVGAIGREPALDFLAADLLAQAPELESRGLLAFIGDVKNGLFRQTAIAVGEGVLAAMRIQRSLQERDHENSFLHR